MIARPSLEGAEEQLRRRLAEWGWTANDLADRLGVSWQEAYRLVRGGRRALRDHEERLAEVFGGETADRWRRMEGRKGR